MAPSTEDGDGHRQKHEKASRGEALDRARINEIVAQLAALPVVDDRSPDELIGYDERGLPN